MPEKLVGKITHYFNNIGVGVVEVNESSLKVGDTIHVKGTSTDFEQQISSMQIEHENVTKAKAGQVFGLKVDQAVHEGDEVFKVE